MGTRRPEWPTVLLVVVCYACWGMATTVVAAWWLPAGIALAGLATALHGSLTHEIVHGHPFPGRPRLNAALAFPALGLFIPYGRFRDTHLAHHNDSILTDPYDDPETNYLDPTVWSRLPRWVKSLLLANNTLLGRLTIGPALGLAAFVHGDWRLFRSGDRSVRDAWLWHVPALALVGLWFVAVAQMPVWAYLLAVYIAHGILKIRTFLEHQAHDRASGRTVIVEDRGPLAFMFLNNNFHVVHHMHPKVPWYRLPDLYRTHAEHYRRRNGGYVYRSYAEVFRRYFLSRKDPVPHPLRPH